jgi:uncharacterized membrane protein YraQ (UPF0718 family)
MEYISLKAAQKYCRYSQDYLKLRARQGKLKALKIGRNWVTMKEWVEDYGRRGGERGLASQRRRTLAILPWLILALVLASLIAFFFAEPAYLQWLGAGISNIIPGRVVEF